MSSLNSLRVRLPLLFLAGILIAGLVTGLIAIQLFRDFARNQTLSELRRESKGIAQLYSSGSPPTSPPRRGESRRPPTFAGRGAREGDRRPHLLRRAGEPVSRRGPGPAADRPAEDRLDVGELADVRLHPAAARRAPTTPSRTRCGLGRRRSARSSSRRRRPRSTSSRDSLVRRLAIASAFGLLVAVAFAWYVSRRVVDPLLTLSRATDEVAAGSYDVELPLRAPGRDRPPRRAVRRDDLAAPGVGGARAELPDDGLARAAHAADRDPRPRRGALRRGSSTTRAALARSRSSRPRRSGSSASSATSSTWRGSTRTASRCCARRSGWSTWSSAPTRPSPSRRGPGRSTSRVTMKERPVIVSDGDRVLQIVDNLLANAFRATPDGGRIGLELGQDERDGVGRRRGHGARDRARATASGCSGRSSRTAAAPVWGSRSRASCRTRWAARSASSPRSGAGRASSSSCRRKEDLASV